LSRMSRAILSLKAVSRRNNSGLFSLIRTKNDDRLVQRLYSTQVNGAIPIIESTPSSGSIETISSALASSSTRGSAFNEISPSLIEMKMHGLVLNAEGASILYTPVHWLETALATMHDMSGLPWWATIIGWTCMIKAFTLPMSIAQIKSSLKLQAIRPIIEPFQQAAKQYQEQGNLQAARIQYLKVRNVMREHQCSPFKTIGYGFGSIPVFIAAFMSIKEICDSKLLSFQNGGALWFQDLTVPDPYYLLPIISACGLLLNIEASRWMNPAMAPGMRWAIRFASLASIPLTASLGSSILIYFGTLNFVNAFVHILWRSTRIRSLAGIPSPANALSSATSGSTGTGFMSSFREAYQARMKYYQQKVQLDEQKKRIEAGPVEYVTSKK
jgi:YidC/Oxa1 family membrane protein insertase